MNRLNSICQDRSWPRALPQTMPRYLSPIVLLLIVVPCLADAAEGTGMRAFVDPASGQLVIVEAGRPVLQYNHRAVRPSEELLAKVSPGNRKYAVARSNYIHPLYGPDGQVLTEDWSVDHPHHRGIYWAWPEVEFNGQRGDLHALQHVFARPTGTAKTTAGADFAQIQADNIWKWEDTVPIVRERTTIRAGRADEHGRVIDLKFEITALKDGVSIARRGTNQYGGLNIRLSPVKNLQLTHHADPAGTVPRRAWSDSIGIRAGGERSVGFAVFERATNPDYPGDWVKFENLPWFQPTFPAANTRYVLKTDAPLVLEYRLWIRRGDKTTSQQYAAQWDALNR